MHTVELLPDASLDATVRRLWQQLHHAGLRSLATHTHPTNRPHITLAVAQSVAALPPLRLPIPVRLNTVRPLGRALVCEVSSPLLREVQAAVQAAVDGANPLHEPAVWVPHFSLALNMPAAQQETALRLLADLPPLAGQCVAARSYDTESRAVTDIGHSRREITVGALYDYFRAPDVAGVRRHMDEHEADSPVPEVYEGLALKRIDPSITLARLVGFATDQEWRPGLVEQRLVWPEDGGVDHEGPWVTALDDRTRDVLAGISAERRSELAGRWATIEEFGGHSDAASLSETIQEFTALAARARERGESLYCWMSL